MAPRSLSGFCCLQTQVEETQMTEEYGSVGLLFSDFTKLFQDDSTYYMTVRTVWVWLHHVWTKILYEKRPHPFLVACGCDWTKAENLHIIRKLPHLCPLTAIERGSKYFLKQYFHKINCFTICKLWPLQLNCEIHLYPFMRCTTARAVFPQYLINWWNYLPSVVLGLAASGFSH